MKKRQVHEKHHRDRSWYPTRLENAAVVTSSAGLEQHFSFGDLDDVLGMLLPEL
jgi:hypothetical protein